MIKGKCYEFKLGVGGDFKSANVLTSELTEKEIKNRLTLLVDLGDIITGESTEGTIEEDEENKRLILNFRVTEIDGSWDDYEYVIANIFLA